MAQGDSQGQGGVSQASQISMQYTNTINVDTMEQRRSSGLYHCKPRWSSYGSAGYDWRASQFGSRKLGRAVAVSMAVTRQNRVCILSPRCLCLVAVDRLGLWSQLQAECLP